MSHIIRGKVKLNPDIVRIVCQKLNLPHGEGQVRLYSGTVEGFWFQLPNWKYPVVISKNELFYDNFDGRWGKDEELVKFYGEYVKEVIRSANMNVISQTVNENGEIEIIAEEF